MKDIGKIIGINLAVLVAYSLMIRGANGGGGSNDKAMGILFVSAIVISLHVIANIIIMIVYYANKKNSLGNTWLLSSGVVLLVGFSTCWGNATW